MGRSAGPDVLGFINRSPRRTGEVPWTGPGPGRSTQIWGHTDSLPLTYRKSFTKKVARKKQKGLNRKDARKPGGRMRGEWCVGGEAWGLWVAPLRSLGI